MMELGAKVCTPKSPQCLLCPVKGFCKAYEAGMQVELPAKAQKIKNPVRYGTLYFIENPKRPGEFLFETCPEKGLLGGMTGVPGSGWYTEKEKVREDLSNKDIAFLPIEPFHVTHVFTHFRLELNAVYVQSASFFSASERRYFWHQIVEYDKLGLPSVYKKAVNQYFSTYKKLKE
jgi:A/G-specific adenine glycosylase